MYGPKILMCIANIFLYNGYKANGNFNEIAIYLAIISSSYINFCWPSQCKWWSDVSVCVTA